MHGQTTSVELLSFVVRTSKYYLILGSNSTINLELASKQEAFCIRFELKEQEFKNHINLVSVLAGDRDVLSGCCLVLSCLQEEAKNQIHGNKNPSYILSYDLINSLDKNLKGFWWS